MKIIFDAVPLFQERPTGVGRTEAGLIASLAKNYPDVEFVGHYFDFLGSRGRRGFKGTLVKASNVRYKRTVILPGRVFNMLRRLHIPVFYEFLVKERGDFHLFPNFLGWPSLFHTPSALYIHDATYTDTPEYVSKPNLFDLKTILPGAIKRASFIITNTNSSRKSISNAHPGCKMPFVIAHIPPVANITIKQEDSKKIIDGLNINKKFILFHATIEPRKNLPGLIEAYKMLPKEVRAKYTLVISGGKGWRDREIDTSINDAIRDDFDILRLGYTTDEERAALFMNTELYVIPSFYEGFGMQILEAFFYKAPVLASNIPVLKEIGGEACSYCETDPQSLSVAIDGLLADPIQRKSMLIRGAALLGNFKWDKVAAIVYESIVSAVKNRSS